MPYIFLFLTAGLNTAANFLLKRGTENGLQFRGLSLVQIVVQNHILLIGMALYATSAVSYILLLRMLPLSVVYPVVVAATMLGVGAVSLLYLRESIQATQYVGYACLLIGIVLIFSFKR